MDATFCLGGGRNLINSILRGKKWSYIIRRIGQTIIARNRTQNMSDVKALVRWATGE